MVNANLRRALDWLRQQWFWIICAAVLMALGIWAGPQVWMLMRNEEALQTVIADLGWLGPLALVLINVLQIVVAPIPGYVMQAAAGYLYGPFWGGVWGSIGLLAGAMLAMALARTFGRPLVERFVGGDRLEHWESVTFSTSTFVWFTLLAVPSGDLPYFLAGLAHVSYRKIFALTMVIRVPFTFIVAAAGAGIWNLTGLPLTIAVIGIGALLVVGFSQGRRIIAALDRHIHRRLSNQESG